MLACIHEIDERLNENGGFMADNMSAEEIRCLLIDDEFDETVVVMAFEEAEGIPFDSGGVVVINHVDVITGLSGSSFGHADVCRFGIGVRNGGYDVVTGPAPIVRRIAFKEVVRDNFGFVVRFMTKRRETVDIAERPDAFSRRFEKFVCFNIAATVNGDIRIFQAEKIR